ncbi:GNAT family N-acyltransferase [Kushneria indalinina]|uniref:N-acyl amino acid synthase of PEP-CTERM/exosortase system n=1 Tax=Kushneria indalinina DSM 14324 TaxID=1122140 RepID=A0A3D9DST8_9GAMM|nr:GNAT family N-acyltransferase [Kushneria indalinina]REC93786.1 N-acyl amino acid synthase of PEP-CTERM/exosortase system [Kushneria indalinina DSM 14324]
MDIVERFFLDFEVRVASSNEDRFSVYSLRYKVFLQELGYKLSESLLDGQEKDLHDNHAIPLAVICRHTGRIAGCTRIVLPVASRYEKLPVEDHCGMNLYNDEIDVSSISREKICEVSRIVVANDFRKSSSSTMTNRLITPGLYAYVAVLLDILDRPHMICFLETNFARLLSIMGLQVKKVSEDHDVCGIRAAHYLNTRTTLATMSPAFLGIMSEFKKQVSYTAEDLNNIVLESMGDEVAQ